MLYITDLELSAEHYTNPENLEARASLIRERGGKCTGEVWKNGFWPTYAFDKPLSEDEMIGLGLKLIDPK